MLAQVQQGLGVEHGRHAVQGPQLAQLVLLAGHQVVVNGVHQHRHGGHILAGHPLEILIEGTQAAQVLGPALPCPGKQAAERAQMEHGQHGHVVHPQVGIIFGPAKVVAHAHMVGHHRKEVALAEHDALAAPGGAGGEHQHHQLLGLDAVVQLLQGLAALKAVHGPQQAAVGCLHLLIAAMVLPVGKDQGRLHQFQLVVQLLPALALVQGHHHAACQHHAVAVDGVLVAVVGPQADALAPDVRYLLGKVVYCTADIPGAVPVLLFHHSVLGPVVPAEGHPVRKALLHVQRQQLIQIFRFMQFHCRFPLYSSKKPVSRP